MSPCSFGDFGSGSVVSSIDAVRWPRSWVVGIAPQRDVFVSLCLTESDRAPLPTPAESVIGTGTHLRQVRVPGVAGRGRHEEMPHG
jgi:hypothetical protein